MKEVTEWRWQFFGFESAAEGQPVQLWFDDLPEDVKDEIRDLIRYLEKLTNNLWRKPEFDGLRGEQDISELRPCNVSVEIDGSIETATYRIYGFFGPRGQKGSYT